ncbi:MAG: hypothetical protein HYY93_14980 [Planctomycetes bacterium]|nr:hypothetical protein [Planctomycetota bacterium]
MSTSTTEAIDVILGVAVKEAKRSGAEAVESIHLFVAVFIQAAPELAGPVPALMSLLPRLAEGDGDAE